MISTKNCVRPCGAPAMVLSPGVRCSDNRLAAVSRAYRGLQSFSGIPEILETILDHLRYPNGQRRPRPTLPSHTRQRTTFPCQVSRLKDSRDTEKLPWSGPEGQSLLKQEATVPD